VRRGAVVAQAAVIALSSSVGWASGAAKAIAAGPTVVGRRTPLADSARLRPLSSTQIKRAPSSPPLISGTGAQAPQTDEEAAGGSTQAEADPLVSNGLGSPLCKGTLGAGALSASSRRDCETSGFSAAAAPTGNYGIDVHIDTGLLGLSSGGLLSIVQDLFVVPLWMALVWSVHALVVMLEWCFTIDLLDSAAAGGVGRGLRQMQASFTEPWLASVLAVAAVLALYGGLVRRRVADTLGQALAMGTMMVGGLWVIADPAGTVGALGRWANQASLGTLAVSSRGTPSGPGRALVDSMATLFASAVEAPWCYLEFGDVSWCRNPARLDPRLREAGLKIAVAELAMIGCNASPAPFSQCAAAGSTQAKALEHSASLLRYARSNGAIFLALPANGPARNSINQESSLLRAMCQSSEATHCRGPTAAQAEFRTNGGTWPRVGGLLMIVGGVLGMMLLFGFLALRLLGAAIFSLLYLLLAPAVVLAPALGDAGRAVFRKWAAQLLSAVVSKLLFSFLLGVVLGVLAILASLEALGWWTQWLLMSAFWWGAFARRHQALSVTQGAFRREPEHERASITRRLIRRLETRHAIRRAAGHTREKLSKRVDDGVRREQLARAERKRARAVPSGDVQVMRMLESERREASRQNRIAPEIERQLSLKLERLQRLAEEHSRARAAGNTRRAAELAHRSRRVESEIERHQGERSQERRSSEGVEGWLARGKPDRGAEQERASFLAVQAALPGSIRAARSHAGTRRDYASLAGLAGLGREEYSQLGAGGQRIARLQIDRELALRRELPQPVAGAARDDLAQAVRPAARPDLEVDRHRMRRREPHSHRPRSSGASESSVMRDAREVAARRKRQLGRDRP
jgi:hypothetical protein